MLSAGAVGEVLQGGAPGYGPERHHVGLVTLQAHVQPCSGRQRRRRHGHVRRGVDADPFDVGQSGFQPVVRGRFLKQQTGVEEGRPPEDIPVAPAFALVDPGQAHGEVVLPGAGVDGQRGQLLGAVEHHQDVPGHVVADLQRRFVLALLLDRHPGDGEQNALGGLQAHPVPVEVADVATHHQAVDDLVRVHVPGLGQVGGVDDLAGRWLGRVAVYRLAWIQAWHQGEHDAADFQDLLFAQLLGNQTFAGGGDACHAWLLQGSDQGLLVVVEVGGDDVQRHRCDGLEVVATAGAPVLLDQYAQQLGIGR